MSVPNSFTSGTVISSSAVNANFTDLDQDKLETTDRQNNTANATKNNQRAVFGWGYVTGDGAATFKTKAVTFPFTFDDYPVVLINPIGAWAGAGTPADISGFTSAAATTAHAYSILTNGFTVRIDRWDAANLGNGYEYGFSWIAIGTKAGD